MDILEHNRAAWDRESSEGSEWSTPVDGETIRRAREGDWIVILTPTRPVPRAWFGDLAGRDLLCLASGGGQQAPVLAAAGARVVSFDLSDEQLARDREVARREALDLRCVQGDMADLSVFPGGSFDLVFHPVSNVFVPDLRPVWRECHRVLRPGGILLAGFMSPAYFLFDHERAAETGQLVVEHALPYAEPASMSPEARARWEEAGWAAQFGHSLEDQIGGQCAAGFLIADLYEDAWTEEATPLARYAPVSIATRAIRRGSDLDK